MKDALGGQASVLPYTVAALPPTVRQSDRDGTSAPKTKPYAQGGQGGLGDQARLKSQAHRRSPRQVTCLARLPTGRQATACCVPRTIARPNPPDPATAFVAFPGRAPGYPRGSPTDPDERN